MSKPLFSNFSSLSKKKRNTPATAPNTRPHESTTQDHTSAARSATRTSMTATSRSKSIPSTDTFSNLSQYSNNPALRTRNPARKRHSVMIFSNLSDNNQQEYTHSSSNSKEVDDSIHSNTSSPYKSNRHSRSTSSLIDFSKDFDDLMETTQDSDTILNDFSNNGSKDYSNTITDAFSSFNNQLNGNKNANNDIPNSVSIPASLSSQASSPSRTSSTTSPRQGHHPLRKLLIHSPNNKPSGTASITTNATSTSNSSRKSSIKNNEVLITPSPTPSPLRRLNPLENPASGHKKPLKMPKLHIFKPDLSNEKPQLVSICNCLFFQTSHPIQKKTTPPTPTTDIFNCSNIESPIKKTQSGIKRHINHGKDHDHAFLSSLSIGLVDPDLFTQNATSVFSGSHALTIRHRTSLHFV